MTINSFLGKMRMIPKQQLIIKTSFPRENTVYAGDACFCGLGIDEMNLILSMDIDFMRLIDVGNEIGILIYARHGRKRRNK